ncbi:HAD family phosphatase [Okibacterium endophyticum]
MTIPLPAAVLWDMDGTLVDTEPYWIQAETDLVESFGHTWTYENALLLVGSGLWQSAAVLQSHGVDMEADAIVARLTHAVTDRLSRDGVPFRPGAQELLRSLHDRGVPQALVTMSVRSMAELVVTQIPFDAFGVLVTGDEVAQPKPHPEPYLTAAEKLGVDVTRCVALEDSRSGIASAIAAGTIPIAIPHAVNVGPGQTHTLWETLAGRTVEDLSALVDARLTGEQLV